MRTLLAALAFLAGLGAARAAEYDYLLAFPSETAAEADLVVGPYHLPTTSDGPAAWRGDVTIPGVVASVIATGAPIDAQWRIVIALPARNPALDASPAVELIADRDAASAGAPMAQFILYSNLPLAQLSAMALSPNFAGSNYPFGSAP